MKDLFSGEQNRAEGSTSFEEDTNDDSSEGEEGESFWNRLEDRKNKTFIIASDTLKYPRRDNSSPISLLFLIFKNDISHLLHKS